MNKLKILALLLVMLLTLSVFISCHLLPSGSPDSGKEDNDTTDKESPDDCNHVWANGVCTECGESDPNYVPPHEHNFVDGKCECGESDPNYVPPHEHNFVDGKCECGESDPNYVPPHEHNFVDGKCECGESDPNYIFPHEHNWADGVCQLCKEVCSHSFSGDTCEICGFINAIDPPVGDCAHVWENGECLSCGKVCDHDFGDDITCSICGELLSGSYILLAYNGAEYEVRYESTLGEFISEHLGTTYEATVKNGSYWMAIDLNMDKVTLDADTQLCNFGAYIELYYIDAGVNPPDSDCDHEWIDGYCNKCGETCEHSWYDSVCTDCGKECMHEWWMPGECGTCGLACEHEWNENRCTRCDLECMHYDAWLDGECTVCGAVCQHNWILTQCDLCGMICEHEFDGYSCINCGYISGGIDNPVEVCYEDMCVFVPYSASFYDIIALHLTLDYDEMILKGEWEIIAEDGTSYPMDTSKVPAEYGRRITLVYHPYDDGECMHYWVGGVCDLCGAVCKHEWVLGHCSLCSTTCEHSFNDNNECEICGYTEYSEYVNVYVTIFYWQYPDHINPDIDMEADGDKELMVYYDKLPLRAGEDRYNTLANFITEYNNWNSQFTDFEFYWYINGEDISNDTLLTDECELIAVDKNGPSSLSPVISFSVPFMNIERTYLYDGPVSIYYACARFEEEFNIDTSLYNREYVEDNDDGDGIVIRDVEVSYIMDSMTLGAYLVTDYGVELLSEQRYYAIEHPTYAQFLEDVGISSEGYIVVNSYGNVIDFSSEAYSNVYLIEESKVDDEFTVSITFTENQYATALTGTLTLTKMTSLYGLIGTEVVADDGSYFFIPSLDEYLFVIDGVSYTASDDKSDLRFIYTDCTIVISPCYTVWVSYENSITDEYINELFIFDHEPCGADVIAKLGKDVSLFSVLINSSYHSSIEEFDGMILSYRENNVQFIPNKVRLNIYITDEYGNELYDLIENDLSYSIDSLRSDYGEGYEISVLYPNGTVKKLAKDESLTLYYDPSYSESEYSHKYTRYEITLISPTFPIYVSVDGMDLGTKTFNKGDKLTLGEILESYYGLNYDDYDWACMNDGSIVLSKDYVPEKSIQINGSDMRPHLTLRIDNVEYKVHHTSALSLSDAIDLVNEKYGTEFTYAGYTWYVYNIWREEYITDPSTIVINEGEINSVSARSLQEITVYFQSDLGPVNEDGSMEGYAFTKDSEWSVPEIGSHLLEMGQGIITFTGEFEYRAYSNENGEIIERRDICSIEDLFSIGLEEITLYAKYTVNYDKTCGTYVIGGEIYLITENTITVFSSWNNYSGIANDYKIVVGHSMISFRADDGSFDYPSDYFGEYSRVDEDDLCIVLFRPEGYADLYDSYEYYLEAIEYYNVDCITDINGNYLDTAGETGIYFVHISEKNG